LTQKRARRLEQTVVSKTLHLFCMIKIVYMFW
jgi:hypothetical protein